MAIDFTTLFTNIGKAAKAGDVLNAAVGTTIPDEIEDWVQQFTSASIEVLDAVAGVPGSLETIYGGGRSLMQTAIIGPVRRYVIKTVLADNPQPTLTEDDAIAELLKQMQAQSESLKAATTTTATPAYGSGNVGSGVMVASVKRGDGLTNELMHAEDIEGIVRSVSANGEAGWFFRGEQAGERLKFDWPGGSGAAVSLTSYVAESSANLIPNGALETEDDYEADLPEGWIAAVAQMGTTVILSAVEQQTVIMSSTPTAGYYVLHYTNAASIVQSTKPIAYNASGSAVQAALRELSGLEAVTVATTGTSPDFTHTITFTGVTNPGQLTSTDSTTGGSIAHNTTVAGSANVMRGARSLELASDNSENTALYIPLTGLLPATQYALAAFMKISSATAGGIEIQLFDGIGGTAVADDESTANLLDIDTSALTTSFVAKTAVFRTPSNLPEVVYLRILIDTPWATESVYIDNLQLVPMTELYPGGPSAAKFTGVTEWKVGDTATLAIASSRNGAGSLHEWMDRIFDLKSQRLLLPVAGSPTQADTLIA